MRLTSEERRTWITILHRLRKRLPTRHPTFVESRPRKKNAERYLWFADEKQYRLIIDSGSTLQERINAFCHGYAHCLDHLDERTKEEHRNSWGLWLARVERALWKIMAEIEEHNSTTDAS